MSTSKFCWIIGDDDLLMNDAIKTVLYLLDKHKKTDYFFINSFHLDSKVIGNYKSPINPVLIKENMSKFSNKLENFECDFVDLINPNILLITLEECICLSLIGQNGMKILIN